MTTEISFPEFCLAVVKSEQTPLGTAFIDNLHKAGKHTLANALAFMKADPFGKATVAPEALAFVRRCW